jgi:hypothetical protein
LLAIRATACVCSFYLLLLGWCQVGSIFWNNVLLLLLLRLDPGQRLLYRIDRAVAILLLRDFLLQGFAF